MLRIFLKINTDDSWNIKNVHEEKQPAVGLDYSPRLAANNLFNRWNLTGSFGNTRNYHLCPESFRCIKIDQLIGVNTCSEASLLTKVVDFWRQKYQRCQLRSFFGTFACSLCLGFLWAPLLTPTYTSESPLELYVWMKVCLCSLMTEIFPVDC